MERREQWKNSRSNGNFYSVKVLSKVLERSFAKTQSKRAIKYEHKTRFMEETLVVLPRNHLKHKVCGGIFGQSTHKIASHKQP
jgi:hypothetical protein